MNNQGAQCLMSGSPLESIRWIRRAMQTLRSVLQGEGYGHHEEETTLLPTQLPLATAAAAWTSFRWSAAAALHDGDMAEENGHS
jgi:hypothetical protein